MSQKKVRLFPNEIAKKITLSDDGKQLTLRIPKKISTYMDLRKGDEFVIFIDTEEEVKDKRHHTIKLKTVDTYG